MSEKDYPDIEVIPADPRAPKKLDWKVYELDGWEIKEGFSDIAEGVEALPMVKVLREGMHVMVRGLFGWHDAKVVLHPMEHVESEHYIWPLKWVEDQRGGCWTTASQINKKCLEVIKNGEAD